MNFWANVHFVYNGSRAKLKLAKCWLITLLPSQRIAKFNLDVHVYSNASAQKYEEEREKLRKEREEFQYV